MADYSWWITVLLVPAALAVIGFFAYVEFNARQIKTRVERTTGGLRFVARGWSVEMQRGPQRVMVKAQHCHHRRIPLDGGAERKYEGASRAGVAGHRLAHPFGGAHPLRCG